MSRRVIIGKSKIPTGDPNGFKMQIQTTAANQTFTLPTQSGYNYNATVFWGDGTQSNVTSHNINNTKTYAVAGTYYIEIRGTFDYLYFNNAGSSLLVKKILDWGSQYFDGFTNMSSAFCGCSNLNTLAEGGIKEKSGSSITDFSFTFYNCTSLSTLPADLFRYNTAVTNFSSAFNNCTKLQLRSDIFGATPNFGTRVMNFNSCFYRNSFTGTQGTAPALWSATMNASSTKSYCFGGDNSATSLTNYADIPAAWK